MMRKVAGASIVVWMVVLLHTPRATAAPPADLCSLLTAGQASAALGGSVGAGKRLASTLCQWEQQGKPGETLLKLDITAVTVERHNRTKTITLGTVTNLGGVGDDAYFTSLKTGARTNTDLHIKKGDSAVVIYVSGGTKPAEEYQAKEKAVALAILPKL